MSIPNNNLNPSNAPIAWIDAFYSMLVHPIKTLNVLSDANLYSPGISALLGSALTVAFCALAKGSIGSYSSSAKELAINLFVSFWVNVFFWLVLAVFLRQIAALMRIETSTRTCFIVTGWAFLPLVFKASAACFSNATVFGDIVSWCLSAWFLLLQLFAFDSVLKLGRFKTLGIILIVPPCLYFTYFLSMIFAGILMTEGLF